jgi:GTPase
VSAQEIRFIKYRRICRKLNHNYRSGFVAIIGKPNAGKSTLINSFLNKKIAIVSNKPETTRDNIRGIISKDDSQVVFVDTPGIHKPHLLLGRIMVRKASDSILDADAVIFIVDASSGITEADNIIIQKIKESEKPAIVAINKIDAVSKSKVLPIIDALKDIYSFKDFIPISALNHDNLELLQKTVIDVLPEGPKLYDNASFTDKDDIFIISEIIREKALLFTKEEVPHSLAVVIEKFSKDKEDGTLTIEAVIYVERDSQKGILIGQKASMVKRITMLSRKELKAQFGEKILLQIIVKVLKNWRKSEYALKKLGMIG